VAVTATPRLPLALRALAHRDFRLFCSGQVVSQVGTWMQSVSQSWLVLELTNSPFRLGLIGTLQFTPILLLSVVAGALADRLPKRGLLLLTQSVMCLQAITLWALVTSGHIQYWHVAVLAALYGLANALDNPARQSFIAEMVGTGDLPSAIALNSMIFNSARIIGPALAGLAIARWGTATAFAVNAVTFLAVISALLSMKTLGLPRPGSGRRMGSQIAEGVAYAMRTPRILLVLGLVMVVSVFLFNNNVMVPLLARQGLGLDAHGFGLLMAALGVGAVAGALTLGVRSRQRPSVLALILPAVVLAVATIVLSQVTRFGGAAALLAVMGFAGILVMAGANTSHQLTVPDELRGRIMGLHMMVFAGMSPFGAFLIGSLAERFGIRVALTVNGVIGFTGIVALAFWWRARRSRV
jgi:MFS family permease